MRYKDDRDWLFEVRAGLGGSLYSVYCHNPQKDKWSAWPCASWYGTFREAEKILKRYAVKRSWKAVEQDD